MSQTGNKTASLQSFLQKKYLVTAGIVLLMIAVIYGCIQAFSNQPGTNGSVQAAAAVVPAENDSIVNKRAAVYHTRHCCLCAKAYS